MKIKIIASGSKGNSTYVETKSKKFLIDMGITYQNLANELDKINVSPKDLDFILITHTHSDHIKGLQSLVRKTNLNVYITEGMFDDLKEKIPLSNLKYLTDSFEIDDLEISIIHTSHDVDSVGYIITNDKNSFVYITDTGYVNQKYYNILKNKSLYIIESNHDEEMLMNGPYPYVLKQRVIGDKGHLSNHATGKLLAELVGPNTKKIVLAHISEHNNTEDLAYNTVNQILKKHNIEKQIEIAKQHESLETIEL